MKDPRGEVDRQDDHFGEKPGLNEATVTGILGFLQKNSAETGMTEPAYKINRYLSQIKAATIARK